MVSTEEGTTPKKDIPGYRFVETKTLENGDTEHVLQKESQLHSRIKRRKKIQIIQQKKGTTPKKDIQVTVS